MEEFFLAAWSILGRDRPVGAMAPGPISRESMLCYAERAGIEDVTDFCMIISSMDDGYLEWVHAEIEKKAKTPQGKSRKH